MIDDTKKKQEKYLVWMYIFCTIYSAVGRKTDTKRIHKSDVKHGNTLDGIVSICEEILWNSRNREAL